MANIQIAVINESTVVPVAEVQAAVAALQRQVHEHFALVWGIDADLKLFTVDAAPKDVWWLVILDNTDQANALGYHDITHAGLPIGKVFALTDIQDNVPWTTTASHELLEMLGDPDINLAATIEPGRNGAPMTLFAYEVCDACETEAYAIDGVQLSDFVFPSWFESWRPTGSTQFDYLQKIDEPLKLLPGGYISAYDVGQGNGWYQEYGDHAVRRYKERAHVGSRRERRRVSRMNWLASKPNAPGGRNAKRLARIILDDAA